MSKKNDKRVKKIKKMQAGIFNINLEKHPSELFKVFSTGNFITRAFGDRKYSRKEKHRKDFSSEDFYDASFSPFKKRNI